MQEPFSPASMQYFLTSYRKLAEMKKNYHQSKFIALSLTCFLREMIEVGFRSIC
uniref:DUF4372 domain-containing protein n=1 Tax=Syphacia muris TaxID=451379 RepID=A0A0N5A853_9BILA